jgi:uncharacterized protein with PQ loop repeat
MNALSHFFLNVSTFFYLLLFLPQIFLNFKRHSTKGLSLLMYGILFVGYCTDLLYGFGLNMPWQYRLVTVVGLCCLTIQHLQFGYYGQQNHQQKYTYYFVTLIYCLFFYCCLHLLITGHHSKNFYDTIGILTNLCWICHTVPQIIKNYFNRATMGLSAGFVALAIGLNICDALSAWLLHWDYPSKIGALLGLSGNGLLLLQIYCYQKSHHACRTPR